MKKQNKTTKQKMKFDCPWMFAEALFMITKPWKKNKTIPQ